MTRRLEKKTRPTGIGLTGLVALEHCLGFDDAKARGEDLAAPTERPRIEKTDVDWALTFSRPSLAKETRDARSL